MTTRDNTDKTAWYFDGLGGAGCWESVMHRLRMGAAPSDWKIKAEQELDEDWLKFLSSRGVTQMMCFYSKGFGPNTEKPVRAQARRYVELVHKHGMKAVSYLSDTVMLETFALEEPDVVNWLQVNHDGKPVHYGGDQTHRRRGCFNNPKWRAYVKHMIKLAGADGFDGFQPDNNIWWPEPEGCRCPVCLEKFHGFLQKKFKTPEECMDRFGLTTVKGVTSPLYSNWFKPWDRDDIRNPLMQEWTWFRCESIADFRSEIADFVNTEYPGKQLFLPSSGITARNMAWLHGEDHNQTAGITPNVCTEEPIPCVYDPEHDALGSKIRSMRLARRCGSIMYHNAYLAHEAAAKPEAMLGEGLAFNQGAMGSIAAFHWGSRDWPKTTDRYLAFLNNNKPLLTRVEGVAEIAVLHSSATLAFDGLRKRMCAVLAEQTLIQNNLIFDIILDRHLTELSRYRFLILPGSTCLSDKQAELIAGWVHNGGALVATDGASSKDQWARSRPWPALAEVFGWPTGDRTITQTGEGEYYELAESFSAEHAYVRYGRGNAVFIPELEFNPGPPKPDNQYYQTHHWTSWQLPENAAELVQALSALGYKQLKTTYPRWVVCELLKLSQLPGYALHVLNYRKHAKTGSGSVTLSLSESWQGAKVNLYSPEWDGARQIDASCCTGKIHFIIPEFDNYCVTHITENEKSP